MSVSVAVAVAVVFGVWPYLGQVLLVVLPALPFLDEPLVYLNIKHPQRPNKEFVCSTTREWRAIRFHPLVYTTTHTPCGTSVRVGGLAKSSKPPPPAFYPTARSLATPGCLRRWTTGDPSPPTWAALIRVEGERGRGRERGREGEREENVTTQQSTGWRVGRFAWLCELELRRTHAPRSPLVP